MAQEGIGIYNPESDKPSERISGWLKTDEELGVEAQRVNEISMAATEILELAAGIDTQIKAKSEEKAKLEEELASLDKHRLLKKDTLKTGIANLNWEIEKLTELKMEAEELAKRIGHKPEATLIDQVRKLDFTFFSSKTNNYPTPEHLLPAELITHVNSAIGYLEGNKDSD